MNIKDHLIYYSAGNLYWKDRQGKYLGCNAPFVRIAKLNDATEIVGRTDRDLFFDNLGEEHIQKLLDIDAQVMEGNIEVVCEEIGINELGEKAIFLSKKSPIRDSEGNIIGLMGTSIDITKQKQADLIRSEFIRNMEHDLRTPLVGIYGMAEILQEQETDPQKQLFLKELVKSSEKLMGYCDEILDFSKIQSNTYKTLNQSCSVYEIVESVVAMNRPMARYKALDFSLDYDQNIPAQVLSDPHRLKRILVNLIGNALKFTKIGFVKVAVRLEKQTDKTIMVKFIIEDSGIGIAQEKQALLFEHFVKLNPSNKELFKGLGLGLRIVKQFINELDGKILLESSVDQGTRITLHIPFLCQQLP
jgi:PAS domain S-box-containing protein